MTVPTDRRVSETAAIREQTAGHADDRCRQFVEQRLFLFQIGGIEAFSEPGISGFACSAATQPR